jgi:hypothetical protein
MAGVLPVRKIYVDSRYKTSNSKSNSDFKYELLESVSLPNKTVLFVDDVIIPVSFVNIDSQNSKLYCWKYSTLPTNDYQIITLATGNYTAATLRTELENKLNAAYPASSITVVYDASLLIYTINIPGAGITIKIFTDEEIKNEGHGWTGPLYDKDNLNSANEILTNVVPQNASSINTGLIDLRRYHNLYITSPNISSFSTLSPSGLTVIKKVPVTSDYGTIIYDNVVSNHDWIDVSKLLMKTLEFRITDVHGNVIDLRGLPVSFSLMFMLDQD